jgi:Flp pilus assembly protein TadD
VTRPAETLETFMSKVRALSVEAAAAPQRVATIEASDPDLKAALAEYILVPSPTSAGAVAAAYARLRVFDSAYVFFGRALRMDPTDAAAHDGLARLWRDSGLPHLGLTDAHRAVFYAPESPIVHNTLGTVLQAMGHVTPARKKYERALQLEPTAWYALNNLCYARVLEGDGAAAVASCRRAVEGWPRETASRNNLALAYAVAGDLAAARAEFGRAGAAAAADYNLGLMHLARGEYKAAEELFRAARLADPSMGKARLRERQAANAGAEEN